MNVIAKEKKRNRVHADERVVNVSVVVRMQAIMIFGAVKTLVHAAKNPVIHARAVAVLAVHAAKLHVKQYVLISGSSMRAHYFTP
ncbi:hypothetical protein E2R51_09390 [Jeotgalibacillus sp. S-D1]|uniref:hypothetical protein n=1 Tax=Jeotgalibacillus sp. S-D1 TaxID=2552189 RepID=UPI001059A4BB|nr:hypothetical protein [Jeotgalibacillus sp. S-D1]TDL32870.1 hypothetical protein E2R51_09390 [Jeotgalibacillus sp. S-D1]